MTEFFIVNNGGHIVFPPEVSRPTTETQRQIANTIPELNQKGFYFYYHPKNGKLVSFFKGSTGTTNQYYGVLIGSDPSTNLLETFKLRVESAFEEQGWRIAESGRGGDAIYTDLTSASPVEELAIQTEYLRKLLKDTQREGPVTLGTPDTRSALQVCKRLIDVLGPDTRISICRSVVEELPPSDVVVVPEASQEIGAPVRGSVDRLNEIKLQEEIKTAQETLPVDNSDQGSTRIDPENVVEALEEADVNDLGIVVDTPKRRKLRLNRLRKKWGFYGGIVGLLVSLVAGTILGVLGVIHMILSRTVYLHQWPIYAFESLPRSIPLKSWHIILGSLTAIIILTFPLNVSRSILERFDEILPSSKDEGVGRFSDTPDTTEFIQSLKRIKNNPVVSQKNDSQFVELIKTDVFADTGISVYDMAEAQKSQRVALIEGFGLGVVVILSGVIIIGVLALGIGQFWIEFLNVLLGLGILVTAWQSTKIILPKLQVLVRALSRFKDDAPKIDVFTAGKPLVLFGAVISGVNLGASVWEAGDGIGNYLLMMFATETIGRIGLSTRISTEALFFFALSFFIVGLGIQIYETDNYLYPATLLVATLLGVGYIWLGPAVVTVSDGVALTGFVFGGLITGILSYMDKSRSVWQANILALGTVLGYVLVERCVAYQSPLFYDTAARTTNIREFVFQGLEPISSLILPQIIFVIGGLYVLYGTNIVRQGRTRVMILGPTDSGTIGLINGLYEAVRNQENMEVGGRENMGPDIEERFGKDPNVTDIIDVWFEAVRNDGSGLVVHTPYTERQFLDEDFVRQVENLKRLRPQRASNELTQKIAQQFHKADILILAFPVDHEGFEQSRRSEQVGSNKNEQKMEHYIDIYHILLTECLDENQNVIGVATKTGDLVNKMMKNGERGFSIKATEEIFNSVAAHKGAKIRNKLDNGRNLTAFVELKGTNDNGWEKKSRENIWEIVIELS